MAENLPLISHEFPGRRVHRAPVHALKFTMACSDRRDTTTKSSETLPGAYVAPTSNIGLVEFIRHRLRRGAVVNRLVAPLFGDKQERTRFADRREVVVTRRLRK